MSTKIFNGFVIQTKFITKVLEKVENFRPWVQAEARKMVNSFVANPEDWERWCAARKEVAKGYRNPEVDTEFKITVFPDGNRFLGIVFTEQNKWFEEWLKQPGIRDYHYQNQTDRPDNISAESWARRQESWERVLLGKTYGTPAMSGFTIDISDPLGPFPIKTKDPK